MLVLDLSARELLSASLNSNTAAAKPEIKKRAWIFYQHD
jgi:hypothetical protein